MSSRPCSSHKRPDSAEPLGGNDPDAAFALDRLDHDGAGLGADRGLEGRPVVEGHLVEAFDLGAEAVDVFLLAAGRDRGQRPPVERALEGDDAELLGVTAGRLILARHLDGGLVGLGAGIGEEHDFGEGVLDQPVRQALAAGNAVKVRRVPKLRPLLVQGRHEMRDANSRATPPRCRRRGRDSAPRPSWSARRRRRARTPAVHAHRWAGCETARTGSCLEKPCVAAPRGRARTERPGETRICSTRIGHATSVGHRWKTTASRGEPQRSPRAMYR